MLYMILVTLGQQTRCIFSFLERLRTQKDFLRLYCASWNRRVSSYCSDLNLMNPRIHESEEPLSRSSSHLDSQRSRYGLREEYLVAKAIFALTCSVGGSTPVASVCDKTFTAALSLPWRTKLQKLFILLSLFLISF